MTKTPGDPKKDVVIGRRPVEELLRSGAAVDGVMIAKSSRASAVLEGIEKLARAGNVGVRRVERTEIEALAAGGNHQGVAALTGRYRYTPLHDLLATSPQALLFLDGIMDPHNLGSLLRSADGAGFDGVVIPAHRSSSVTQAVRRVSAGAAEVVTVARETNLGRALESAREAGMWIVGLDHEAKEDLWSSSLMDPPVAVVLGSEDRGISKGIRTRCDGFAKIPTLGRISSLNASVAGALAMFEVTRRRARSATL
jgi:23S rRNA (guanosine2251-2'-O)-methyltransferase